MMAVARSRLAARGAIPHNRTAPQDEPYVLVCRTRECVRASVSSWREVHANIMRLSYW
jgi:hypothetical protein